MAKNDSRHVLYYAVGAFNRTQRAERDARLLKDAATGPPGNPNPVAKVGAPPPPAPMAVATGRLRIGVRSVAERDEAVSLEIERFKPGWPGADASGAARDAGEAFHEWLASPEGRARFANSTAVALHAVDIESHSAER